MSDRPTGEQRPSNTATAGASDQHPAAGQHAAPTYAADDELRLAELWSIVWAGKWWIVGITFVFAVASVAYALLATEWYRAEVLLAPAERNDVSQLQGQLGGLAALAGVSIGGSDSVEAVATLRATARPRPRPAGSRRAASG